VDWKNRLVGIKGARGVGKTTLILQYIKQNLPADQRTLYVSLDDLYFTGNRLVDLADDFVRQGGEYLFLDEVHRYPGWSQEIKNIYDDHAHLRVVFTGSSILEINRSEADLSRRVVMYDMHGLSFREFLFFSQGLDLPVIPLQDILTGHAAISDDLVQRFKPIKEFNEYLRYGYYPYFLEGIPVYHEKLASTIHLALESDIPFVTEMPFSSVSKMKKLLYFLSTSVPFTPNIQRLSQKAEITRNTVIHYLHLLWEARIIDLLYSDIHGIGLLQKPDKIYMHHPNLMFALSSTVDPGAVRETFVQNQIGNTHRITYSDRGDFVIDGKVVLEVGGKNKSGKQIRGMSDSYIAADNVEYGYGNKIPIWLFGFLY
jgi:hypothetical protein